MVRVAVVAAALSLAACQQAPSSPAAPDRPAAASQTAARVAPAPADARPAAADTAASAPAGEGLCRPGEPVLFSCSVRSGKIVSICGAAGRDGSRFPQYRYGRAGSAAELIWPASPAAGRIAFASVPYSGGGEAQLMFDRADVRYVVYSRVIRTGFGSDGHNDPLFQDGVAVLRGRALVSRQACTDARPHPVDYDLGESLAAKADAIVELPE